jgi:hypothetical protein
MKKKLVTIFICILIQFIFIKNTFCQKTKPINDSSSISSENSNKKAFLKSFNINKIDNIEREFAEIYINGIFISPPTSIKKINKYLNKIKDQLNANVDGTATFKYGNNLDIQIKLPILGAGKHGLVFEIIDETEEIKKIFKLNIKQGVLSLKAGIKERYNYTFWNDQAKSYSFEVASMYDVHPYGLYMIKEKNNGVSLTSYLISQNIIFQNEKKKKKVDFKTLTQAELDESPIKEISQAVLDLLDVIKNNRKNCTSISPNNIFLEFNTQTNSIQKVELIDYGISTHKIYSYFYITNFNQYIKMSSKRLTFYLKNNYVL